jgi:hypothetical protein
MLVVARAAGGALAVAAGGRGLVFSSWLRSAPGRSPMDLRSLVRVLSRPVGGAVPVRRRASRRALGRSG